MSDLRHPFWRVSRPYPSQSAGDEHAMSLSFLAIFGKRIDFEIEGSNPSLRMNIMSARQERNNVQGQIRVAGW